MKKITKEMRKAFIEANCEIRKSPCEWDENKEWVSIYMNGYYLTASTSLEEVCKDESVVDLLIRADISEVGSIYGGRGAVACIGFSPKNNKWFGWSHRGVCGFTIGSRVQKGDCAYMPANKKDFEEDAIRFWSDPGHLDVHIRNKTDKGFDVYWQISCDPELVPNVRARGTIQHDHYDYPRTYGRGEWEAKTIEDAKQMAMDYAEGVS